MLVSVCFLHSVYADHDIERAYRSIENSRNPKRRAYKLWEEISTLNSSQGVVSDVSVLDRTPSKRERRLDETMADDTELRSA